LTSCVVYNCNKFTQCDRVLVCACVVYKGGTMSQISSFTTTLTTVLASVVASFIAVDALLNISNQLILWIGLCAIVYVYVIGAKNGVNRRYQRTVARGETPSEDLEVTVKILAFLDILVVIVLINLVVRFLHDEMVETDMDWDDYIIMGVFCGFVIFIAFHRMTMLYLPAKKGGGEF
jgi:hypothetical protein